MIQQPVAGQRTFIASEGFQREERLLNAANRKDRPMSEETKPEANPEELKKEELEGVSGGAVDSFIWFETHPTEPPAGEKP